MARGLGDVTVTLAVLDRLIDREPENRVEAPLSRAQSVRLLKSAVRRDLEWLLNTRRIADEPEEGFREVNRSLYLYGLPDFSAYSMAIENVLGVSVTRRALLAIGFGLVHGFAFSQGLQEQLQFAGGHLITALFAFNIGIEMGQLMALAVMLPLVAFVLRYVLPGRVGSIILALLIGHVAWHWMVERWDTLSRAPWPGLDVSDLMPVLLWSLGLAAAATGVRALLARLRVEPAMASRPDR